MPETGVAAYPRRPFLSLCFTTPPGVPVELAFALFMWTINLMNNTENFRPGTGELPAGRPLQTEFDTGLDYPRLGSVTFRRGTLTENQEALFDEHWPRLGRVLAEGSDERIDVDEWFGRSGHPTIVEIGSGTVRGTSAGLMLTGDENIVDLDFEVQWQIDAAKAENYVFNIQNSEGTIKAVAESAMREVIGRPPRGDVAAAPVSAAAEDD